jgi:hypothetical protein
VGRVRAAGWVVAVVVSAALGAAPPASAGGTAIYAGPPGVVYGLGGPALAGDRVAWVREAPDGGYLVETSSLDGSGATRQRLDAPSSGYAPRARVDLATSQERLAMDLNVETCDDETSCKYMYSRLLYRSVLTAPAGGGLERAAGCTSRADCEGHYCGSAPRVDVSGNVVAYADCRDAVVHDYSSAAAVVQRRFRGVALNAVDGSSLAVNDPGSSAVGDARLVVYDWRIGVERYHVAGGSYAADLRPDATVAFVRNSSDSRTEAAWASPAEPFAHPVPGSRGYLSDVRIGGDRVAYSESHAFAVRTLSGALVGSVPRADALTGFDFDGVHLAWVARPCFSAFVLVWDMSGDPPTTPAGPCPLAAIQRGPLQADAAMRRIGVPVQCPATPALGCSAEIAFTARRHDRKRGRVTLATARACLEPGARATLRGRLRVRSVCAVRRDSVRTLATVRAPGSAVGRVAVRVLGLKPLLRGCP